ncbi:MAG: protein translocase subunit SecF [Candidatus Andeanibacterium colombiense]|uniref:Protein-export membrane protein SecF n=1 Tax=Candidatus Andeanibacterium colombiense TaxID=3121345 RepID=A0AAJ6BN44_9SPHN|nr:MAG: protein translocase subunit SecF [Sphingomonadaceae bacterium]
MRLLKLVPHDTDIKFLRWQWPTTILSVILMVASWVLIVTNGLNFGVDFVGGQMIRVTFTHSQAAPVGELRSEIEHLGYGEPVIQNFGAPNAISIRMRLPEDAEHHAGFAAEMSKAIIAQIQTTHPDVRVDGVDSVSGKVSKELGWTAFKALGFAAIAISIYIWFRFEWQFGVGTLISLIHDVTLVLGLFALTQMEFDLTIVAALLTVIGYSLNDTIVIYDRIRENLKKYRKMPVPELLDLSVNETLARTIMVATTMLVTLVVLLLFGPKVIFGFSAALILGIFVGTYSSIYAAAPMLVWLGVRTDSFVPEESAAEKQQTKLAQGEV